MGDSPCSVSTCPISSKSVLLVATQSSSYFLVYQVDIINAGRFALESCRGDFVGAHPIRGAVLHRAYCAVGPFALTSRSITLQTPPIAHCASLPY
jgi:hypothetical protein